MNKNNLNQLQLNKNKNAIFYIVSVIICAFVFISYVRMPLTGDLQVFLAAANQVKFQAHTGLMGVFESWELKGIGNRLLMYFLYVVTKCFAQWGYLTRFEDVVKTVYGLMAVGLLIIASVLISKNTKDRFKFFLISYLMLFATYTQVQLQAEMTAVILCLIIISLLTRENAWAHVAAGVIGSFLFFFKSIFIVLFFVSLAAAYLLNLNTANPQKCKKNKYLTAIISFLVSQGVLLLVTYALYPQEFKDMYNAGVFQSTIISKNFGLDLKSILKLPVKFVRYSFSAQLMIPFLPFGIFCTLLMGLEFIQSKKWNLFTVWFFMCFLPVGLIIAANNFFAYHYLMLALPASVCIYWFLNTQVIIWKKVAVPFIVVLVAYVVALSLGDQTVMTKFKLLCLFAPVLVFFIVGAVFWIKKFPAKFISLILGCVFGAASGLYIHYFGAFSKTVRLARENREFSSVYMKSVIPEDFGESPVLFLDSGDVPFVVDAPSYSRYFFNLPLMRWRPGDEWDIQKSEYQKFMDYQGKYIVYSVNFGIDKYPELKAKLNNEYKRLEGGDIYLSYRPTDFYNLKTHRAPEEMAEFAEDYILVRK